MTHQIDVGDQKWKATLPLQSLITFKGNSSDFLKLEYGQKLRFYSKAEDIEFKIRHQRKVSLQVLVKFNKWKINREVNRHNRSNEYTEEPTKVVILRTYKQCLKTPHF